MMGGHAAEGLAVADHGWLWLTVYRITGLCVLYAQAQKTPWPARAGHEVWAKNFHRPKSLLAMARHAWPMVFGLVRPMAQTPWPAMAGHGVWARKFHRTAGLLAMARHGWPLQVLAVWINGLCGGKNRVE